MTPRAAAELDVVLDAREQIAFHLDPASFFEPNPDARLLTLMEALETLIDQPSHPTCRRLLRRLILLAGRITTCPLPRPDHDSQPLLLLSRHHELIGVRRDVGSCPEAETDAKAVTRPRRSG
jgi:hypothetical protein